MGGAGLKRSFILHHGFNTGSVIRSGEPFGFTLTAFDHRHGQSFLNKPGVNIQHLKGTFHGFIFAGMGRMPLLP